MTNALLKKQGSIDHHVHIVLHLAQRVVVIVHVHLHRLPFRLRRKSEKKFAKTVWMRLSVSTHLQSVVILQTLAGRHSQIILTWSTNNINLNKDSELSTNHEEDRSLDAVNVPVG